MHDEQIIDILWDAGFTAGYNGTETTFGVDYHDEFGDCLMKMYLDVPASEHLDELMQTLRECSRLGEELPEDYTEWTADDEVTYACRHALNMLMEAE